MTHPIKKICVYLCSSVVSLLIVSILSVVVLAVFVMGAHESPVRKGKGYVLYNPSGEKVSWWLLPDSQVTASLPGRLLRQQGESYGVYIAESFTAVPSKREGVKLAVAGRSIRELLDKDLSRLESLVLLNPAFPPEEIPALPTSTKVYIGEYAKLQRDNAIRLRGVTDFIPDWINILYETKDDN